MIIFNLNGIKDGILRLDKSLTKGKSRAMLKLIGIPREPIHTLYWNTDDVITALNLPTSIKHLEVTGSSFNIPTHHDWSNVEHIRITGSAMRVDISEWIHVPAVIDISDVAAVTLSHHWWMRAVKLYIDNVGILNTHQTLPIHKYTKGTITHCRFTNIRHSAEVLELGHGTATCNNLKELILRQVPCYHLDVAADSSLADNIVLSSLNNLTTATVHVGMATELNVDQCSCLTELAVNTASIMRLYLTRLPMLGKLGGNHLIRALTLCEMPMTYTLGTYSHDIVYIVTPGKTITLPNIIRYLTQSWTQSGATIHLRSLVDNQ